MGEPAPLRLLPMRTRVVLALVVMGLLAALVLYVRGPHADHDQVLYHRYALAFWAGSPPLRSLPAEYPLLSLLPFTLTLLPPLPDFVTVFAVWMLALLVGGLLVVARRESPRVAEVCGVYLALGAWATVLGRYDLVPAAVTVVAWWAVRQRRFTAAYGLLAAGTLLKLYPALLVPVVAIEQWRALGLRRGRPPRAVVAGIGLFCGAVAAGFLAAFLLDPAGWLGPLTYGARRPLQVESLPATLLWAGSALGFAVRPDHSFGSDNLVGRLDGVIGLAAQAVMVAGLIWAYGSQAAGRLGAGRAFAACLLIAVCTGRVLSPQYLVWVLPLVAIAERDFDPLWLLVCVLTSLVFPFAYGQLHPVGSGPPSSFPVLLLGLIALRNALLAAATVRFLRLSRTREGSPDPRPAAALA